MRFILLLIGMILFSPLIFAQETDSAWGPASPVSDSELDSDWLQLKHDEWIKGDFLSLRNDELIFDSNKFGQHTLKWEDVTEFHTYRKVIIVLLDGRVLNSRISLVDGKVLLPDADITADKTADKADLISIVTTSTKWWELWDGRISASLNLRSGNTNQADFQFQFDTIRRSAFHRLIFYYIGNYSRVEKKTIVNSHNAAFNWNYFLNYKMYLIPISYEFNSDIFRNISQQHSPRIGFGYELYNSSFIEWDILGGVGYRYLLYDSVEVGGNPFSQSVTIDLGTKVDADITDSTEIDFSYDISFDLMNYKNIIHNLSTRFFVDITNNLELNVMFSWGHVGDPERREDGTVPEKNDYSLSSGISFEY